MFLFQILTALVQGVSIPVTCKIRILPTVSFTQREGSATSLIHRASTCRKQDVNVSFSRVSIELNITFFYTGNTFSKITFC